MDMSSGVNLGQLLLALGVMLVACGAAWGSTIARLSAVEKELDGMKSVSADIAVIKERTEKTANQVDKLVEKLFESWLLKEPAPYVPPTPPRRRGA